MQKRYLIILSVFWVSNLFAVDSAKINNVNFIQEGEVSKLIIDVSDDVVAERTHIKDDKQILLDIKNVTAAKKQLRGIDTSEFSGSSVYISPYKKPGTANDIRFAIQLRDNVRSFIERRKNRIILHIENRFGVFTRAKLKKAEEQSFSRTDEADEEGKKLLVPKSTSIEDILENITQSGVKRYVGKRISINVNELPYTEVLKMIGDTSGFNIIIDSEVTKLPPLTINLTNLPWDQVLDTILNLGKLVAIKHGNILSVKTEASARSERQQELDAQNASKTLEPLVTKIFPLSYATPADITKILTPYSTKERGSIAEDTRTQNLIVKDTVDVIERMKKIVDTLDTQTPQILIESKIIESRENYELRVGLEGTGISFDYDAFTSSGNLPDNDGSFSFSSLPNGATGSVVSASINVLKRVQNLNFKLDLLEEEQKIKIISSPKIITENNKAANIDSTDSQNFRIDGTETTPGTIESVSATTNLSVTPKVTNEGSIIMKVDVSKDSFGEVAAGQIPPVVSNKISTNVLVNNGSTVVVGGIYTTEDRELNRGIPFLKDLPIIGWLFRSAYNPKKFRNELVIFITPRIVNQEEAGLVNRELGDIGL